MRTLLVGFVVAAVLSLFGPVAIQAAGDNWPDGNGSTYLIGGDNWPDGNG